MANGTSGEEVEVVDALGFVGVCAAGRDTRCERPG
jgi:hypothetical protein